MITRSVGIRHGRKVLAGQLSRTCHRCLSTDQIPPAPTAFADPTPSPSTPPSSSEPSLNLPKFPTAPRSSTLRNPALVAARKAEEAAARIPKEYKTFLQIEEATQGLGAGVELRYYPDQVLKDAPQDATLELLMASQAHMGHHTSLWNPATSRYIYGVRSGIHIISLEQTQAHMRRAARVVEEVAYYGGLILFVGTRKGQMPIVVRAAELAGAYHLFNKWTPGTITNRDQILAGQQMKVVDELDRTLKGFEPHLQGRRAVLPDLVVCLNPLENYTMLAECGQAGIPTIGVIDTNADPSWVTYTIPANDDSYRAVAVIATVLGRAGERGQARRLKDARNGIVPWQNPADINLYMQQTAEQKAAEMTKNEEAKGQGSQEER